MKSAARNAADNLDFDEVETLLARVDEVETELVAETKELCATNALLRGKVSDAFRHFSATADAFTNIEETETARRQSKYGRLLYEHGLAGNQLLGDAVAANRASLRVRTEQDHPVDWAVAQNNFALVNLAIAEHESCNNPVTYPNSGLKHIEAALTILKSDRCLSIMMKQTRFAK